jgi:uncharacterized membrane protein
MKTGIFSDSAVLGYIVIVLIAFLLGVTVTAFSIRLKKMRKLNEEDGAERGDKDKQ